MNNDYLRTGTVRIATDRQPVVYVLSGASEVVCCPGHKCAASIRQLVLLCGLSRLMRGVTRPPRKYGGMTLAQSLPLDVNKNSPLTYTDPIIYG